MTNHLPPQFDKYTEVVKEGEELFGDLYRAFDSVANRTVALKMPHPELLRDPAFIEQFRQEAGVAAQLDHANIVHIYSIGELEGAPFLEMEVVEGQSLAKLMGDKGVFRPFEALPIVNAICAALQEAHSKGVIHGTLSPHDVLLRTSDNRIWVSEFGLAKAIDAGLRAELGSKRKRLAALRYLSPEQVNRQEADIGAASDLYSLGVILYEMLTGDPPFTGNREEELVEAHTSHAPAAPSKINSSFSQAIESVLLKALAKQPQDRFSSAEEMAEAYRAALWPEDTVAPAVAPTVTPADRPRSATRLSDPVPSPEATPVSPPPAKTPRPSNTPSPVKVPLKGWSPAEIGVIALFVLAAFVTWSFLNDDGDGRSPEDRGGEPTRLAYATLQTAAPAATAAFPTSSFPSDTFPTAQPTPDRTIANVVGNTPIQHLGFDDDPEYWSYSTDSYEQEVIGDELAFIVHQPSYNTWRNLAVNSTNYYAEVAVTMEDEADVSAGIAFNYQDEDNFYLFLTDPDGYYSVWQLVDGEWETILSWVQSDLFETGGGATNLLGVHMDGSTVRLLVNRNVIGEITLRVNPTGGVAFYTETYAATDAVTRFGNFSWWDFAMPSSSNLMSITVRLPTETFDLSANPQQWTTSSDAATYEVVDGTLEVTLHEANHQSWQTFELESTDYYLEAEVTIHATAEQSTTDQIVAGLIFDVVDDDNFYSVSIDVDGHYAIHQRSDGEWTDLQDWIYSPLLRQGSETINRIGVMTHEDKFWITANGQLLDTVNMMTGTEGVGLIAGTYEVDEAVASFDNVRWWNLTGVLLP